MPIIDVHTHFIPPFVAAEASAGGAFGVRLLDGDLVHPEGYRYPLSAEFVDPEAKLAEMDGQGVDVAVMSIAPTMFFYDQDRGPAVEFAHRANDAMAEFVGVSPRLRALAALPLQDPEQAAAELRRTVLRLGFVGAEIGTNCGSRPLDDPELEPVLAAAAELGVPLMLHPYYVGVKPGLEDFYFTNSIGNPLDTCVATARLIHAGVLDRYPELVIVLVHGGGFLPYQIGRLDHAFSVRPEPRREIDREPSSYLGRIWFDTITHGDPALQFLASRVGLDRLVLGSDLPFDMADRNGPERLRRVGIDPHVVGATAQLLFAQRSSG